MRIPTLLASEPPAPKLCQAKAASRTSTGSQPRLDAILNGFDGRQGVGDRRERQPRQSCQIGLPNRSSPQYPHWLGGETEHWHQVEWDRDCVDGRDATDTVTNVGMLNPRRTI